MRTQINEIRSENRFKKIKDLKEYTEVYPIIETNSIFINPENEAIIEGAELYDFIYNKYYLNRKYGNIIRFNSEDVVEFNIENNNIYMVFKQQIGDNIVFTLKEEDIPDVFQKSRIDFILSDIEIVKYSDISKRNDIVSKTGYDVSFLKKLLRKLLPGKYRIPMSNDSIFWSITYKQKI